MSGIVINQEVFIVLIEKEREEEERTILA